MQQFSGIVYPQNEKKHQFLYQHSLQFHKYGTTFLVSMRILTTIIKKMIHLPRRTKQFLIVCIDAILLFFALWSSYSLRFGSFFVPSEQQVMILLFVPAVTITIFMYMGVYRAVIRYIGEGYIGTVFRAMALTTLIFGSFAYFGELQNLRGVPRTIPLLYLILGTMVVASSRFAARGLLGRATLTGLKRTRVAICGVGNSAHQLISALKNSLDMSPIALIDNDKKNQKAEMLGLPVFSFDQMTELAQEYDVSRIIICSDVLDANARRQVAGKALELDLDVQILPALGDIVSGKHLVSHIRQFNFIDLLGRKSVSPDPDLLAMPITGKSVLVTGAGGFIGSELTRQIFSLNPRRLILFDFSEFALYEINRQICDNPGVVVRAVLGSMANNDDVKKLFADQTIDTVFHVAAYKHVPMLEENVIVGVRNNVLGTLNVVTAARKSGVERFVLISSDKAVLPTNVMGATKRWAELVVQMMGGPQPDDANNMRYCAVRFGNVLNSGGSVVPLFHEQIKNGGPVTVTDAKMTRYFMSVGEATELIIQAASLARGGDVFLLDMGKPIAIMDIARGMIQLAGLSIRDPKNPDGDIEIVEIGKRPGEKIHEQLFYDSDRCIPTRNPKILRGDATKYTRKSVLAALENLETSLAAKDISAVKKILFDYVNESQS